MSTQPPVTRARRSGARPAASAADEPLHQLLAAMSAVRDGDFSVQLPIHWDGLHGKLAATPACGVPMPPSATQGNPMVTSAQLETVRAWIAAGAPND